MLRGSKGKVSALFSALGIYSDYRPCRGLPPARPKALFEATQVKRELSSFGFSAHLSIDASSSGSINLTDTRSMSNRKRVCKAVVSSYKYLHAFLRFVIRADDDAGNTVGYIAPSSGDDYQISLTPAKSQADCFATIDSSGTPGSLGISSTAHDTVGYLCLEGTAAPNSLYFESSFGEWSNATWCS